MTLDEQEIESEEEKLTDELEPEEKRDLQAEILN